MAEQTVYQEKGYEKRTDYLKSLAEDYGVDYHTVLVLADMLGPCEDFDGLPSSLEDNADMFLGEAMMNVN